MPRKLHNANNLFYMRVCFLYVKKYCFYFHFYIKYILKGVNPVQYIYILINVIYAKKTKMLSI